MIDTVPGSGSFREIREIFRYLKARFIIDINERTMFCVMFADGLMFSRQMRRQSTDAGVLPPWRPAQAAGDTPASPASAAEADQRL